MPEPTPEVAVVNGTVWLRWDPAEEWVTVRRGSRGPILGRATELAPEAARMVDLGWSLRGVAVGDIYPVGGVAGDCRVMWQVYPGVSESWWVCTLPQGHEHGSDPLPHVAASYSRVEAVLDVAQAEQELMGRSGRVQLAVVA